MSARVVIRRRIRATREELFEAWTDPDSIRMWMCPGNVLSAEVRLDLRVGGPLLITMRSSTETFEHRGEFTIIERPSRLAFTWIAKATDMRTTLVTVEFLEVTDTESDLVLTHDEIPKQDVGDQYRGGWNDIISRLEKHLKG